MGAQDGIYIVGPTASGKTGLSVCLAQILNGEIINADSMQIYGQISIGTARPTEEEMQGVPHHLFGFIQPGESYSVSQYVEDAFTAYKGVRARGKLPVFTGGTGLYMDALLYELDFGGVPADENLRKELREYEMSAGKQALYQMLAETDPISAEHIQPNDSKRVIRALEVFRLTGKSIREYAANRSPRKDFKPVILGLYAKDRQVIYDRINMRTDMMFKAGLTEEGRKVLGMWPDSQVAQAIGYKEFREYFDKKISLEETAELIKRNTRRYAKRQHTWFKRNQDIKWMDITDKRREDLVSEALSLIGEVK